MLQFEGITECIPSDVSHGLSNTTSQKDWKATIDPAASYRLYSTVAFKHLTQEGRTGRHSSVFAPISRVLFAFPEREEELLVSAGSSLKPTTLLMLNTRLYHVFTLFLR